MTHFSFCPYILFKHKGETFACVTIENPAIQRHTAKLLVNFFFYIFFVFLLVLRII